MERTLARFRVLLNPTYDIESGELLYHDGEFHVEQFPIRCDRSIAKSAGQNASNANSTAGGFGTQASQISSSLVPQLERQANTPTGLTATQKNNALVSGSEAVGGTGAGATGAASLTSARTKNAGGFSDALDEAARIRGRQSSANALGVESADVSLANEKQQQAQKALQGLYGVDTQNQMASMGLANQDLNTELKANDQGWLQNTEGVIGTLGNVAKGAGSMGVGFGQGQTFGPPQQNG